MLKHFVAASVMCSVLGFSSQCWSSVEFRSERALVVDEATGEVLLDKNASTAAPIASVTKLMTIMVVLDGNQDPDEVLTIERADVDRRESIRTCLPVGSKLPRSAMVTLALLASDNHAAAALARSYEGGRTAFDAAMQQKIADLELTSTTIDEPTGLSPLNAASPQDLVKVLSAAKDYPEIAASTSQASQQLVVNGRERNFKNTNGLVGMPGWDILMSKTGTTLAAGRCLAMRVQSAGRTVLVVLMGAVGKSTRVFDAMNVRRFLSGEEQLSEPIRVASSVRMLGQHRHPSHTRGGAKTRRSA